MLEGDSADTCTASVDGGLSGGSSVRWPGSEDPHRRYRKFIIAFDDFTILVENINVGISFYKLLYPLSRLFELTAPCWVARSCPVYWSHRPRCLHTYQYSAVLGDRFTKVDWLPKLLQCAKKIGTALMTKMRNTPNVTKVGDQIEKDTQNGHNWVNW